MEERMEEYEVCVELKDRWNATDSDNSLFLTEEEVSRERVLAEDLSTEGSAMIGEFTGLFSRGADTPFVAIVVFDSGIDDQRRPLAPGPHSGALTRRLKEREYERGDAKLLSYEYRGEDHYIVTYELQLRSKTLWGAYLEACEVDEQLHDGIDDRQ